MIREKVKNLANIYASVKEESTYLPDKKCKKDETEKCKLGNNQEMLEMLNNLNFESTCLWARSAPVQQQPSYGRHNDCVQISCFQLCETLSARCQASLKMRSKQLSLEGSIFGCLLIP